MNDFIYVVKKGDSLRGLAQKYLNDPKLWADIFYLNHYYPDVTRRTGSKIDSPDLIFVGQKIAIPLTTKFSNKSILNYSFKKVRNNNYPQWIQGGTNDNIHQRGTEKAKDGIELKYQFDFTKSPQYVFIPGWKIEFKGKGEFMYRAKNSRVAQTVHNNGLKSTLDMPIDNEKVKDLLLAVGVNFDNNKLKFEIGFKKKSTVPGPITMACKVVLSKVGKPQLVGQVHIGPLSGQIEKYNYFGFKALYEVVAEKVDLPDDKNKAAELLAPYFESNSWKNFNNQIIATIVVVGASAAIAATLPVSTAGLAIAITVTYITMDEKKEKNPGEI